MLVNNHWISEEIKEEIKISSDKQIWKHDVQNIWDKAKVILRQTFIAIQSSGNKKILVSNLTPRASRKRRKNKTLSFLLEGKKS